MLTQVVVKSLGLLPYAYVHHHFALYHLVSASPG